MAIVRVVTARKVKDGHYPLFSCNEELATAAECSAGKRKSFQYCLKIKNKLRKERGGERLFSFVLPYFFEVRSFIQSRVKTHLMTFAQLYGLGMESQALLLSSPMEVCILIKINVFSTRSRLPQTSRRLEFCFSVGQKGGRVRA